MSLRSPLARVRGLGSAKDGTSHWWAQRVTAIALVPLTIWFVISVIAMVGADYETFRDWIGSPLAGGLMLLLVIATFYHAFLGVQVVIEDYVHHEGAKVLSHLLVRFASIGLGLAAGLAILKLIF
jgi:succinate dehydrogenase / fumarate reductase membrane anchor subunit